MLSKLLNFLANLRAEALATGLLIKKNVYSGKILFYLALKIASKRNAEDANYCDLFGNIYNRYYFLSAILSCYPFH